ncbi:MAG: hypothetical protein KatS3mg065_0252 [Chloroflexota bacterium]|nr:MAG: hypothetical protein KatS3mg065_0252 [Chloroflexota bacterium]
MRGADRPPPRRGPGGRPPSPGSGRRPRRALRRRRPPRRRTVPGWGGALLRSVGSRTPRSPRRRARGGRSCRAACARTRDRGAVHQEARREVGEVRPLLFSVEEVGGRWRRGYLAGVHGLLLGSSWRNPRRLVISRPTIRALITSWVDLALGRTLVPSWAAPGGPGAPLPLRSRRRHPRPRCGGRVRPDLQRRRRHRPGEKEALGAADPELAEDRHLLARFDPLGDDVELERAGQRGDGADDLATRRRSTGRPSSSGRIRKLSCFTPLRRLVDPPLQRDRGRRRRPVGSARAAGSGPPVPPVGPRRRSARAAMHRVNGPTGSRRRGTARVADSAGGSRPSEAVTRARGGRSCAR